jgi:molybdopterin synthase catalytic subunit
MKTQLTITPDPIDEATLIAERQLSENMGAVVVFHGVVRGEEAGESITALDYEANEEMARHQFGLIFAAIDKLWPVESVRLIHRVGIVSVNELSLWVEVIAPHRAEAFAACQFLIDEMKGKVPIWKRPKQL